MKVILDCDITMGVPKKDVDDGLALIYLLGSPSIELLAVCTTFGNSTLEIVHDTAISVFTDLGLHDTLPLYKGAATIDNRSSEAAIKMVELVNNYPHEITLLGIGSLTNLLGAQEIDPTFFSKIKNIVLMGGITEPLIINGKQMPELNFASDPEAAYAVISSEAPITIITGHLCLQALFTQELYDTMELTGNESSNTAPIHTYIKSKTSPWIEYIGSVYKTGGFHNWDAVAALYLDHPDYFDCGELEFSASIDDLKDGYIVGSKPSGKKMSIPTKIRDIDRFNQQLVRTWQNVTVYVNE